MELSEVKNAIKNASPVEMTGPPDFAGITYTVRGVIMRLNEEALTGTLRWVYFAELLDKTGCVIIAPLDKVAIKRKEHER